MSHAGVLQNDIFTSDQVAGNDGMSGNNDSTWSGFMGSEDLVENTSWAEDKHLFGEMEPFDPFRDIARDIQSAGVLPWLDQTLIAPSPDPHPSISTAHAMPDADPVLSLFQSDDQDLGSLPGNATSNHSTPVSQLNEEQDYRVCSVAEANEEAGMHVPQPSPSFCQTGIAEEMPGSIDGETTDDGESLDSPWRNRTPRTLRCFAFANTTTGRGQPSTDEDSTDDGGNLSALDNEDISHGPLQGDKKRKRSPGHYRVVRSRQVPHAPSYPVMGSQEIPGQSRAIDWRRLQGLRDFELEFASTVLRLGGVKSTHRGTCVLGPDDFRLLESSDILLYTARPGQLPTRLAQHMMYEYSDHRTELVLAAAWFQSDLWPHTGFAFDNFLGVAYYQPMTASHLCGQPHCLIHVVYEAITTKQDRQGCLDRAKATRRQGQDIPPACSMHNPPCLLQHGTLTTEEVFLIQSYVLSSATGVQRPQPFDRPNSHPYPTFETRLPMTWNVSLSAIEVEKEDLIATLPNVSWRKPDFPCNYCPGSRPYTKVLSLWAHIYYKHPHIDRSDRLDKIRQSATTMDAFLRENPTPGGGSRAPLLAKLRTAISSTFCWDDVVSWRLTR
ncbi:MAG: hypothetical protein LQ337_004413 [Flavoplaca oasis]|nr:MAG: hypothetical protein LQ337_004413 [Flavoplaca oasis]